MTERNAHKLDPLLRPASLAVVGASERPHSVGRQTMENLLTGQYPGRLYAVNPGYGSILGIPCYPDLASLPVTVEHVVLALGDKRVEAALDDAIAHGASRKGYWRLSRTLSPSYGVIRLGQVFEDFLAAILPGSSRKFFAVGDTTWAEASANVVVKTFSL